MRNRATTKWSQGHSIWQWSSSASLQALSQGQGRAVEEDVWRVCLCRKAQADTGARGRLHRTFAGDATSTGYMWESRCRKGHLILVLQSCLSKSSGVSQPALREQALWELRAHS